MKSLFILRPLSLLFFLLLLFLPPSFSFSLYCANQIKRGRCKSKSIELKRNYWIFVSILTLSPLMARHYTVGLCCYIHCSQFPFFEKQNKSFKNEKINKTFFFHSFQNCLFPLNAKTSPLYAEKNKHEKNNLFFFIILVFNIPLSHNSV